MDKCEWCGIAFIDGEEAYNGLYHYNQMSLDGHYICIGCYNKYNKAVSDFQNMYIKSKGVIQ